MTSTLKQACSIAFRRRESAPEPRVRRIEEESVYIPISRSNSEIDKKVLDILMEEFGARKGIVYICTPPSWCSAFQKSGQQGHSGSKRQEITTVPTLSGEVQTFFVPKGQKAGFREAVLRRLRMNSPPLSDQGPISSLN